MDSIPWVRCASGNVSSLCQTLKVDARETFLEQRKAYMYMLYKYVAIQLLKKKRYVCWALMVKPQHVYMLKRPYFGVFQTRDCDILIESHYKKEIHTKAK